MKKRREWEKESFSRLPLHYPQFLAVGEANRREKDYFTLHPSLHLSLTARARNVKEEERDDRNGNDRKGTPHSTSVLHRFILEV